MHTNTRINPTSVAVASTSMGVKKVSTTASVKVATISKGRGASSYAIQSKPRGAKVASKPVGKMQGKGSAIGTNGRKSGGASKSGITLTDYFNAFRYEASQN
jgi:hypothetical protein